MTVGGLSVDAFTGARPVPQPALPTRPSIGLVMMPDGQQQQQPATVPVICQMPAVAARPPAVVTGYLHRQSIALGIVLIVIGTLSAVFNIVNIVTTFDPILPVDYQHSISVVSYGIWGGVLVRTADTLLV